MLLLSGVLVLAPAYLTCKYGLEAREPNELPIVDGGLGVP